MHGEGDLAIDRDRIAVSNGAGKQNERDRKNEREFGPGRSPRTMDEIAEDRESLRLGAACQFFHLQGSFLNTAVDISSRAPLGRFDRLKPKGPRNTGH